MYISNVDAQIGSNTGSGGRNRVSGGLTLPIKGRSVSENACEAGDVTGLLEGYFARPTGAGFANPKPFESGARQQNSPFYGLFMSFLDF